MSRRRQSEQRRAAARASTPSRRRQPLSPRRRAIFTVSAILLPFLLLLAVEGVLRVACSGCAIPVFVEAPFGDGRYEVANRGVSQRWFPGVEAPPTPPPEPFARTRPGRAFRVFVLGESSTAGFPYPRNVTFSRLIGDVLRDVLPDDSVEVVNLGIAATNSFALADMADAIARRRPDAVLIYAGHNEYYGALGVGSRLGSPFGSVRLTRGYLWLLDFRLVMTLRRAITAMQQRLGTPEEEIDTASLMEMLGRDQQIALGSGAYAAGVRQLESNLSVVAERFRRVGIPVLLGSVASNIGDLPPFAAAENALPGGAAESYERGRAALASGDTVLARDLFLRARDLDVVRFRAPGEFNDVIRRVAERTGAVYVPVEEAFAAQSPGGIPGGNLFLEHVHPTRRGYALIARVFVEEMRRAGLPRDRASWERMREWESYENGMHLTTFDERIAYHTTRTLTVRWPFVRVESQGDYRGSYRPEDLLDSLAFAVSRGAQWEHAKLQLAEGYERRGEFEAAAREYAGLARDAPMFEEPLRLQARALMAAGLGDEAEEVLRRALAIRPAPYTLNSLALLAVQRQDPQAAIALFIRSLQLDPAQPAVLYQLSLVYATANDVPAAREAAVRLARMAPDYPGLADWLRTLGIRR
jgi:tetratricopeptide (TPR) repeat protein